MLPPDAARRGATGSRRACTCSPAPRRSRCCSSSCGASTPSCSPRSRASRDAGCCTWRSGSRSPSWWRPAIFQLVTGLANPAQWYPWSFSFRLDPLRRRLDRHRRAGGAHRGQAADHPGGDAEPLTRAARARPAETDAASAGRPAGAPSCGRPCSPRAWPWSRRRATPCPLLRKVSVFAVRTGEGPQGVPINRSAAAAGVTDGRSAPAYRLTVSHGDREVARPEPTSQAMTAAHARLPIACVEGWSAGGHLDRRAVRRAARPRRRADGRHVGCARCRPRARFGVTEIPAIVRR